ncbi:hypothetical protein L0337_15965 [candidate division KSB1 bacterium]|nr:hypothetical protein [candidate division KSB1 bacterium]
MKRTYKNVAAFFIVALAIANWATAQILPKSGWPHQPKTADTNLPTNLNSNVIEEIVLHRGELWIGTDKGLSRSRDGGKTFVTYTTQNGLPRGGVSALTVTDSIILVATDFDSLTKTDVGLQPTGGGMSYSTDDGQTWTFVGQFGPTPVQNVTYDIAVRENVIWRASWGGGLQRSADLGQTWEIVTPDTFFFDPNGNFNHLAFSIINVDGVLWHGAAGGINKSLDGGMTWTHFSHQNQTQPISGNWAVAIAQQKWRNREYIWAATRETVDPNEFSGVSISEDGGFSWRTTLTGEVVNNFAFDDSIVYAATDNGLFKSLDFGRTWAKFPDVIDSENGERFLSTRFFTAAASIGRLWAGGPDGLAYTENGGLSWKILRGSVKAGENGAPRTYAYPNPFSPFRHNQFRDDSNVRFQYNTTRATKVTVKVYNFAMELVAEVVNQKDRSVAGQYAEVWNGRNRRDEVVANGVYFYRLDLEGEGTFWGKVMVLD